jgi:2-(1,2-epoxy-1,2-dihydrophenyl)acetyl-CoA isomerase
VNKVVAADQLDDVVAEWARRLAAGPPIAMALTKRLLNDSFAKSLDQALSDEAAAQSLNFSTKDTAEALAAFTEKREPRFTGR